ncbi:MAG: ABC transporter substrate-binding protein, partial [Anaerolineae bacterium]|nr:ABC transporter substrate-binding protein [Anaerolineae bacterium]
RYAMVPTDEFAQFRILAHTESQITSPLQLKGATIGISQGTVIEYLTTRLLEREAINVDQVELLPVPKISDRMALFNAGELPVVMLPEPLATLAMQQGALVILDDTRHQDLSCSIYAFRNEVINENPDAVSNFLAAVSLASQTINAHKNNWENLLVEYELVPPPLMGTYQLPDYPGNDVPTQTQYADVVSWLMEKQLLDHAPDYGHIVDSTLLPERQ